LQQGYDRSLGKCNVLSAITFIIDLTDACPAELFPEVVRRQELFTLTHVFPAPKRTAMHDRFAAFANIVSHWAGKPQVFTAAVLLLAVWALFGPAAGFSDQWQLVINTGTTILTFLMVFVIQNTQNRHSLALQIKLDELIRAVKSAKNELIDLEDLAEADLERLQQRFAALGEKARGRVEVTLEVPRRRRRAGKAAQKPKNHHQ
jgi:low affinity Fe/Cu permease